MQFRLGLALGSVFGIWLLSTPAFAQGVPAGSGQAASQSKDLYSMDLESLLNVKVTTASKYLENLSDAPGVMSVVTQDELQRFGGLTLSEILDRVAGLSLSTASFTDRSLIAARGDQTRINGGHILFLINGRPTREILEGGLIGDLLESFPVNVLERIEVIKGPGSVLYGSNAYSAVINLITKKADGNSAVVTGLGSQGQGVATNGEVMFQHGAFSLVGAGQFHQDPDWFTPLQTTYAGIEDVVIPNRSKGAYLGINYKGLSLMSSFTDWTTGYDEGLFGIGHWRRNFADLGYSWKASQKWDMNFDITYTRATLNAQGSIPFITRVSNEAVAEWTNVIRPTDKDRITFGALYNYIQGTETFYATDPSTVIANGSRPGEAFYAQLDHALLENLKLIGGFQANKIGKLSLDVVPRGGVIWNATSHVSFKALYSQAFRAPSLNETLLHYIPPPYIGGPSLLGDPNLAPEKVATVDVGMTYQRERFQFAVDYFHSKMTDTIVLADATTNGHYVNMGQTTFQGVEMEGKYYLGKSFFLIGSGLYQTNIDGSGNSNTTPIPNFGGKGGISYKSANGLIASLFDAYQGGLSGYSNALNPKPGTYNMLNAQVRFDLSRHLFPGSRTGCTLVAHGDNLVNHAVWLPDWNDAPGDSIFYNRGRTVYLGLEFSVKKD
ncbi:MAG TPA: TonB-dependent receptor [Bryobacteraceae bacterium]|nr:TonB-dependent receptor [Bryobacteraceae bacterium]